MAIDGSINLGATRVLTGVMESGALTEGIMTIPAFEVEGATADGLLLPAFTLEATGEAGIELVGVAYDMTLPELTLSGGTADGMTLPAFTLSTGTGTNGASMVGAVRMPLFDADASLTPALPLPEYELSGVIANGNVAAGDIDVAAFALSGTFGYQVDVELPEFALAATALNGVAAMSDITLRPFVASGVSYLEGSAEGEATLERYSIIASMDGTSVISGEVSLSLYDVLASAVSGGVSTADLTIPLYEADGAMGFSNIGTATITLPAFVLAGGVNSPAGPVASGDTSGIAATTVVLNTRLKGVTLYEGIEANSFANFAGITLAATPDGIVALRGNDDMGVDIEASITSGISDMGDEKMKQVLTAYVGYRASDVLTLTLIADDHHEYDYVLEPVQAEDDNHTSRVKFGRGVDGRYWQWTLKNENGGDFHLSALSFHMQKLGRGV